MKNMKIVKLVKNLSVCLMCAALLFSATACSSSYKLSGAPMPSAANETGYDTATSAEIPQEASADAMPDSGGGEASAAPVTPEGRKLIYRASMRVETVEFDKTCASITEQLAALGGYIQSSDISGRGFESYNNRYASIVARVPQAKLDVFMDTVGTLGSVTNEQKSVEDITLQYVDIDTRKKSLKIEQERLIALLEKAEDLESIIALEGRLSEVRYEIESYESQIRTFDDLIDYSTVTIDIQEVNRIVPVEEPSIQNRIRTGFSQTLYAIQTAAEDLFVFAVVTSPVWGTFLIVALIAALIAIKANKSRIKRNQTIAGNAPQSPDETPPKE